MPSRIATTTNWFCYFRTRGYAFASQNVSFPTAIVLDIAFISFKKIAYKNYGYLTNILARDKCNITPFRQNSQ